MAPVVVALAAMRGVALVVAVTIVAEVGDFRRFSNPRQLMAYLGLVPSEHSSGSSVRRGGITKAGNALARRVLIGHAVSNPRLRACSTGVFASCLLPCASRARNIRPNRGRIISCGHERPDVRRLIGAAIMEA